MPPLPPSLHVFRTAGQRTPLTDLDDNFAALATWFNTRLVAVGPIASRPAAGNAGALYIATDQRYSWYLDDGATWRPVGGLGTGGLTVDDAASAIRCFGAGSGAGGQRILTGSGAGATPPTSSPVDTAQLWVADVQGVNGRAAWHARSEDGLVQPVDPVLYRLVANPAFSLFNSSTETTVASFVIKGGTVLPPRSLEVAVSFALVSIGVNVRTYTFRTKGAAGGGLNQRTYFMPTTAGVGVGAQSVMLDAVASNVQRYPTKYFAWYPPAVTGASVLQSATDGAQDMTIDQTLLFTVQVDAIDPGIGIRIYSLTVRVV